MEHGYKMYETVWIKGTIRGTYDNGCAVMVNSHNGLVSYIDIVPYETLEAAIAKTNFPDANAIMHCWKATFPNHMIWEKMELIFQKADANGKAKVTFTSIDATFSLTHKLHMKLLLERKFLSEMDITQIKNQGGLITLEYNVTIAPATPIQKAIYDVHLIMQGDGMKPKFVDAGLWGSRMNQIYEASRVLNRYGELSIGEIIKKAKKKAVKLFGSERAKHELSDEFIAQFLCETIYHRLLNMSRFK